jgi:hypothetical protein
MSVTISWGLHKDESTLLVVRGLVLSVHAEWFGTCLAVQLTTDNNVMHQTHVYADTRMNEPSVRYEWTEQGRRMSRDVDVADHRTAETVAVCNACDGTGARVYAPVPSTEATA